MITINNTPPAVSAMTPPGAASTTVESQKPTKASAKLTATESARVFLKPTLNCNAVATGTVNIELITSTPAIRTEAATAAAVNTA